MNHPIELRLQRIDQTPANLRFQLHLTNESATPLFFPWPQIFNLQFTDDATGRVAEWRTSRLVQTLGADALTLPARDTHTVTFNVRPSTATPDPELKATDRVYDSTCVDLSPGTFRVRYICKVGPYHFGGHSPIHSASPRKSEEATDATLWHGRAVSNPVRITKVL